MQMFFKPAIYMARCIENGEVVEMTGTYEDCAAWSIYYPIRLVKRLSDGLVVIRSGDIQEIDKLLNNDL